MDMLTRTIRDRSDVARERDIAKWNLDNLTPSAYGDLRERTKLAVFDWLLGRRTHAPATGRPRRADPDGIDAERTAAGDREFDLLRAGDREGATKAGIVAEVLGWALCDPMADSPS